ncbi:MAG: hypothetical protein JSU65_09500 [Candidatus Zixiibacteriota bacterium]|nr:MAG: hypothetical protein JSU65_09500 [candidate division Zixibacteria bacterium]
MKNRKQHSYDTAADRAYTMHCSSGIVTLVATCLVAILTFCPNAQSRNTLRCGDEVRLVTQTGYEHQGKLITFSGDSLTLQCREDITRTVARTDLATVHRIKRATAMGIITGVFGGALIGFTGAALVAGGASGGGGGASMESGIAIAAAGIGGGAVLGGIIGGILGHKSQRLGEVQLEGMPVCIPLGKIEPVGVTLAVNF